MTNLILRCVDDSCHVHLGCAQKLLWENRSLYQQFYRITLVTSYGTVRADKTAFPRQNLKTWNRNLYDGLYGEISVTCFPS